MKQKLIILLLFVIALYIVFPSGGDFNDGETSSSSQAAENNLDGDLGSSSDVFTSLADEEG